MKVKSIEINGIGGIGSLKVDFIERINFICGPNGIGKTTLLECVAHSFSANQTNILKRNVSAHHGSFKAVIEIDEGTAESNITIADFDPNKPSYINGLYQHASKLFSLKVTRTFQYQPLNAVGKDVDKDTNTSYQEAMLGKVRTSGACLPKLAHRLNFRVSGPIISPENTSNQPI